MRRKLPEDYSIDALSLEADRRAKALGRRYSYGQLIADTTLTERQEVVEAYRKEKCEGDHPSRGRYAPVDDEQELRRIRQKAFGKDNNSEKAGE